MRILVFADSPIWIFARHYQEIKKRLPEYDFDVVFLYDEHPQSLDRYKGYDLFYLMDPIHVHCVYPPRDKTVIGLRNEFMYEHTPQAIQSYFNLTIRNKANFFHVVNRRQYDEFKDVVNVPFFLAQHGVDLECFKFNPALRKPITSEFVVGTSGSRKSAGNKGFEVVERICNSHGWKLTTAMQNLNKGHLGKEQMPNFYRGIDVYVCFSESEGLNNCIMEAGAMGVPVIATAAGAAKEMVLKNECGFIIERTEADLIEKIGFMSEYRQHAQYMGDNMLSVIKNRWSWDLRIEDFRTMFKTCLESIRCH